MSTPFPIEVVDISWLKPYEANAKKHPDDQVEKIANSIEKFGWTAPIVAWKDGSIIAGHGRRLAAIKMGLKKVPVIIRRDLSKSQADALRLADNRVTSTEYDQGAIQEELRRLSAELDGSFELTDLGFDLKEVDFSTSDLGEIDSDFFVEDVGEAVEKQRNDNQTKAAETDDTAAPVADAFGFKRVTIAQSRQLRGLMSMAESVFNKKGPEALIEALTIAVDSK